MIHHYTAFILLITCLFNRGLCNEISSIEVDRLEFSPVYNAIIFRDIAEIINDMDMNIKQETQVNSVSESDDDEVESLLLEYQHYLDRAQEQRQNYLEKTKGKNKVPLLRHEKFSKLNVPKIFSFDKNQNYVANNIQPQQKMLNNPYDLFIPMNLPPELPTFNRVILNENKMSGFSIPKMKSDNIIHSSCYCEDKKFPCKCKCKQCLIPLEKTHTNFFEPSKVISNSYKKFNYANEYNDYLTDDNLNVKIKMDIQIPKIDNVLKMINNNLHTYQSVQLDDINITEAYAPTNVSFPALNFPIPINILTTGLSKLYQYGYSPIHKISFNKKKKSHWGNQSRKNRSKYFSFHHSKDNFYEPTMKTEKHVQKLNGTSLLTKLKITSNLTDELEGNSTANISDLRKQNETFANIPILVNISSDDNSIDTESTLMVKIIDLKGDLNNVTKVQVQPVRMKRESSPKDIITKNFNNTPSTDPLTVKVLNTSHKNKKSYDNQRESINSDLLYWPKKDERILKNITGAPKKQELMHEIFNVSNTTNVTDKIINKINWNDVHNVALTFATVFGKYAKGIVTFCSTTLCRSLKCSDKICVYRSCIPEERFKQRAHCKEVSNDTTILSQELGPTAPSNLAYDFIDALQKNMRGEIFGKATICYNVKCITFEAINKRFSKLKCLKKELNSSGHCKHLKR